MGETVNQDRVVVREALCRLGLRLRAVRALVACLRFSLVGMGLAAVLLVARGLFPAFGPAAAAVAVLGFALAGALYGLLARAPIERVARLADRRLGLQERLTAAAEHLEEAQPDDFTRAQLADAAAHARLLRPGQVFPVQLPPDARLLVPATLLVAALALLPPLSLGLPATDGPEDRPESAASDAPEGERPLQPKLAGPTLPKDLFPRGSEQQVHRGSLSPRDQTGDMAATFRDTKLSDRRPDFGSFIKQGDDRLKLLARPESLPDLSRDYTQNPYQALIRRMQEQLKSGRLQGLTWEQIERLLSELGQHQQRAGAGDMPDDLGDELQREAAASPDKMLSALARALNRLRDREAAARGKGQNLREAPGGAERGAGKADGEGIGQDEGSRGGSQAGTGASPQPTGDPSQRIAGEKQDAQLEGELREGRTESYDTNLSGPGAQNPSRLQYLDVLSRYRKMMEEALAKEPIPLNYREQVKEYFQSLEAR
jgi:DNA-binding transcriptional MerR regulator